MTRATIIGVALLSGLATWLLSVPDALARALRDTPVSAFAALTSLLIVGVAAAAGRTWIKAARRRWWLGVAATAVVLGVAAFVSAERARQACTARYAGATVLIGTELTPLGRSYVAANPDLTVEALLVDAAGDPGLVWTRPSIDRCRLRLAGTYFLWLPLLAVALLATAQALGTSGQLAALPAAPHATSPPAATTTGTPPRYDAFISYRHGGRDEQAAIDLAEALEAEGYAVAIDVRDFPANAHFLEEMERCIRQSRFTVAVVSARYLESGHCQEEALICRVLDMGSRQRRLIPIYIDAVEVPIWLHGLVGIRLDPDRPVDPLDALVATLGPPLGRTTTSAAPAADPPATSRPNTA